MRIALFITILSIGVFSSASVYAEQTPEQAKAREIFNHFTLRFAENAEPVSEQVVSNCISFYDGMVNKGGAQGVTQDEMYDLFGSLVGWQRLASRKFSGASEMPKSSINNLIEGKSSLADIVKEVRRVLTDCRKVELRAHTAALEKEKVSE